MRMLRSVVASAAVLLGAAAPAWAHVSVQPPQAARGSNVELTLLVPNERDDAATVQLELQLPVDLDRVDVPDVGGWTSEVDGTTVRWRDGRIEPDHAFEFELSVGPLPDEEQLVLKVVQTYDSGEVVRWIDEAPGADHPAPVLRLTGDPADATDEEEAIPVSDDDDLPVGGLVAAVAVVVLAVTAYAAARRRRP